MDTVTVKTLLDVGKQFITKAFEQSPTTGNGFGYLLAVLVVVVIYSAVREWFERRDARKYRDQQDEKSDTREAAASKRAIEEQQSRETARERVIEEQRKHRDELKAAFGAALSPLESRIGALEQREREHSESIVLLKHVTKIRKENIEHG